MESIETAETTAPRIAVLGCGCWGRNLVRSCRRLGALRFVCDPSESANAEALKIAHEVEVKSDLDALYRRSDIDAVAIETPAETHEVLTIKSLAQGKDVFVKSQWR